MPLNHSSQYSELTNEHFQAIGKLTVEWSNIEFLLGVLLSRLLVTPEFLARTYTDRMSGAMRQDAIGEACKVHSHRYGYKLIGQEQIEKILDANKKITQLRAIRNKINDKKTYPIDFYKLENIKEDHGTGILKLYLLIVQEIIE